MIELVIVGMILTACIGYAGWRVYQAVQNPCRGCELRKSCGQKGRKAKKQACKDKK